MSLTIDYTKICFVVMPFGKKKVDRKTVDFDFIYKEVFEPAIKEVELPEGGKLIPKRTDQDYFSANIDTEMYQYLEYSRFVLTDISGLNANVFYELGIRHRANQSGTAIFRQGDKNPPFDISHIKAFPYEYKPVAKVKESIALITKVLTQSLLYNRIDSPVQVALAKQQEQGPKVDDLLQDATNAMRRNDMRAAITKYKQAIAIDPNNPLLSFELGLLMKGEEKWKEAAELFDKAAQLSPKYGEAWREMGVAQNQIYRKAENRSGLPTGEEALRKSIDLNKEDFDALASLGGVYKRMGPEKEKESAAMYKRSLEVSNGHPYPLLNALILQIKTEGFSSITPRQELFMERAEELLRRQIEAEPDFNKPWSYFDLSTIQLLLRKEDAMAILKKGMANSKDWQIKTHLDTLMLIETEKDKVPGLADTLVKLKAALG